MDMNQDKKSNSFDGFGSNPKHLFALMTSIKSGPVKHWRRKMKYKIISYTIVFFSIYMMWTMFFIISELNASLFMTMIDKISKQIIFGY